MDLALELGQPAELLAHTMTERELRRWRQYRRTRLLPTERLELYLAQIAQLIAATMGGVKNRSISDYLIVLKQEDAEPDDVVAAARAAFGYNPRKRKG